MPWRRPDSGLGNIHSSPSAPSRNIDWVLMLAMAALSVIGLAVIYSASHSKFPLRSDTPYGFFFVTRQELFLIGAVIAMVVVMSFDYEWWKDHARFLYGATVMLLTLIALMNLLGVRGDETVLSFDIGPINIQPAEFAKFTVLLVAAAYLAEDRSDELPYHRFIVGLLIASSVVAILTTIGIFMSLIFESVRFFGKVPLTEFLFGLEWSPQTAIRADQVGSSGAFGAVPLFLGTTLIMLIAMVVAVPVGLFAAIYLSEYAGPRTRAVVKPLLEVLAGIPTVVYGFFAALTVAPFLREIGATIGLDVASESALAAGAVMGIMIVPFISSLSDDVINAVPQTLRDGSYAMGATKSETIRRVVLPAALPGIVGAVLLAVSRAIGETMIVVMAAGLAGNLTFNPLDAVTTVTVQIKTLLVGDQEFDSAKTLSAFALGLVLFLVTLVLNIIALRTVQKYREKYD